MKASVTVERLQTALEIMRQPQEYLPTDRWDMAVFGVKEDACGTAACGIGTLSLHPKIREWGLKGEWSSFGLIPTPLDVIDADKWTVILDNFFELSSHAFGITHDEADCLQENRPNELDAEVSSPISKDDFCHRLEVLIGRYRPLMENES